jgi:hypothetical protein
MKKITADLLPIWQMSEQDQRNFTDWVWQMRKLNMFGGPQVLGYPRTVMCRAQSEEEALLYIPLQSVLMWDAIAPKPGITARQEALCLSRIVQSVDQAMEFTGHREVYFFTRDDRVCDIAARHGFEEIRGVRMLRKKHKTEEKEDFSAPK